MAHVYPTLSVIMLNVNRLNTPMRKAESGNMVERKKDPTLLCLQKYTSYSKTQIG